MTEFLGRVGSPSLSILASRLLTVPWEVSRFADRCSGHSDGTRGVGSSSGARLPECDLRVQPHLSVMFGDVLAFGRITLAAFPEAPHVTAAERALAVLTLHP